MASYPFISIQFARLYFNLTREVPPHVLMLRIHATTAPKDTSERHGAIPVISGDDVPPLDRPSPPLTPVFCLFRAVNPANPVVFFDISIGDVHAGRIKMELWADICPQTAENFRQFCTGEFKVPSSQSSHISALLSPLSSLLSPLSRLLLHDTLARIRIHSLPMMILISRSAHPRPHGTEPYPHSHLSA